MFDFIKSIGYKIGFVLSAIAAGGLSLLLFLQKRETKKTKEALDDANDTIQQSQMVAVEEKAKSAQEALNTEHELEQYQSSANDTVRDEVQKVIKKVDDAHTSTEKADKPEEVEIKL